MAAITPLLKEHSKLNNKDLKTLQADGLGLIIMEKMDGVSAVIYVELDKIQVISRTGKRFSNVRWIEELLEPHINELKDYVIQAEICNDKLSLEQLSGLLNPNRTTPLTPEQEADMQASYLVAFDLVHHAAFFNGIDFTPYMGRLHNLKMIVPRMGYTFTLPPHCYDVAYCDLQEAYDAFSHMSRHNDFEGIVVANPNAIWEAGKRTSHKFKMVKECSYDLKIVGTEEGEGKRAGTLGKLIVEWRLYSHKHGELVQIPVDVCWTDVERDEAWSNRSALVGKIVKVTALCISSNGGLRLPKAREIRIDKENV